MNCIYILLITTFNLICIHLYSIINDLISDAYYCHLISVVTTGAEGSAVAVIMEGSR
jgi:hypothetical protein